MCKYIYMYEYIEGFLCFPCLYESLAAFACHAQDWEQRETNGAKVPEKDQVRCQIFWRE